MLQQQALVYVHNSCYGMGLCNVDRSSNECIDRLCHVLLYSVGVLQNSRKLSGQQFNRIDHIFYIWGQPHFYYCGFIIPGVEALVLCSHDKPF